jgi:hypothetical protein
MLSRHGPAHSGPHKTICKQCNELSVRDRDGTQSALQPDMNRGDAGAPEFTPQRRRESFQRQADAGTAGASVEVGVWGHVLASRPRRAARLIRFRAFGTGNVPGPWMVTPRPSTRFVVDFASALKLRRAPR